MSRHSPARERRVVTIWDGDYSIVGLTTEAQPLQTLVLPLRGGLNMGFQLCRTTDRAFYYKAIAAEDLKKTKKD